MVVTYIPPRNQFQPVSWIATSHAKSLVHLAVRLLAFRMGWIRGIMIIIRLLTYRVGVLLRCPCCLLLSVKSTAHLLMCYASVSDDILFARLTTHCTYILLYHLDILFENWTTKPWSLSMRVVSQLTIMMIYCKTKTLSCLSSSSTKYLLCQPNNIPALQVKNEMHTHTHT